MGVKERAGISPAPILSEKQRKQLQKAMARQDNQLMQAIITARESTPDEHSLLVQKAK